MKFPKIDKEGRFYKNCRVQRRKGAKICQCCPFREYIEKQETDSITDTRRNAGTKK